MKAGEQRAAARQANLPTVGMAAKIKVKAGIGRQMRRFGRMHRRDTAAIEGFYQGGAVCIRLEIMDVIQAGHMYGLAITMQAYGLIKQKRKPHGLECGDRTGRVVITQQGKSPVPALYGIDNRAQQFQPNVGWVLVVFTVITGQ